MANWRTYWYRFRRWVQSRRESYYEYNCDSEFFVGMNICALVGKIQMDSDDRGPKRLWKLFRVAMVLVFGLIGWRFYLDEVEGELEFVKLINNVFICSILLVTSVRSALIGWCYGDSGKIRTYCNGRQFLREDPEVFEIRRKAYFVVKNVTVVILSNLVVFLSAPSLMIDVPAFRLPFTIPNMEWATYVCQNVHILMIMTVGVNFMMNVLIIFMILFGLITEGKVVDCAFSRVFDQALNHQDESGFWTELNDRFDECIEQHSLLLKKIALMRNLFESTFLVTYYSTTLHIAGGAFFLISSFKSFDMYMLQMINVIVMQIIECFILSRWTTLLNDVHESIGDTVYDLDWPQQLQHSERFSAQYEAVRAKIVLTIERCNQPLRFSRGAHFEFTQEKFTELMNTAYSLVTFLWDMRP